MTEIHWHSTGNFDEDLKAYFGHLHDRNRWYKHKVKKYLGKKGMDLFNNVHIKFLWKCEFDSPYHLVALAQFHPLLGMELKMFQPIQFQILENQSRN